MKQEAKLGVLGGMGPQATQVFYQFVLDRTDALRDQDHLPALILSDTGIPDRTAAILSGDTEPLYRRLRSDAKLLERCGCTVLAIPCNTSHYFVDRLQEEGYWFVTVEELLLLNGVEPQAGEMYRTGNG